MMTCSVEVFQIKRVVPDLIEVVTLEVRLAHFELDGENGGAGKERRIEATAEARNVEFQEDGTCEAFE